jgi:hypothetical protein
MNPPLTGEGIKEMKKAGVLGSGLKGYPQRALFFLDLQIV